jgi:hypothetical protein
VRVLIDDEVVYDGPPVPVPRAGDMVRRADEERPVEAVTWDFDGGSAVTVTLLLAAQPYAY